MENTQMKPAELLEQVNKAIAAVLVGGQSYKIGSRSLTRADLSMLKAMRDGASGMFETILVTVLVSAMCALIRENGGFEALLAFIRRVFKGRVGGRLGVGLLVGAMDISTANNTVAIVMAGPIAKEISEEYGISPKESASLLDTFSCIFQGIIPYGAQMLIAVSASGISAS